MSAFSGRSVLVTGAGGFIGGHLATRLVEEGADVRALLNYNSRGDHGTLAWFDPEVAEQIEVQFGDVRDYESVAQVVQGTEVVFHLAAWIAIPYSYVNPRGFFETNVLGTLNVAQAARGLDVRRVVSTSTSEVYGTAQTNPITEAHPLEAQSPYAASKIGADKLMESFQRAFDLEVTILRPFNTYGPHQSARAVIPTIVSQALAGDTLRLGSLEPRRDLTYVADTVNGFLAAASAPAAANRTMQLGTNRDVSVGDIVEMVGRLLGKDLRVEQDEARIRPPESEVMRLISSPALATELTGWRPEVSLEEGLARVIEYVREHPERFRPDRYAI